MTQSRVRAVYMRGGTSRCLVFHERDLPPAGVERDYILSVGAGQSRSLRTPARRPGRRHLLPLEGLHHRALDTIPGADVDYTFAQVEVSKPQVDYTGNCGNCSSAVGPSPSRSA